MIIDFSLIASSMPKLFEAAGLTLQVVLASAVMGLVLAVPIVLARVGSIRPLQSLAWLYVWFFRGSPLLVQIFLLYHGSGQFAETLERWGLWEFFREPLFCGVIALTLNTAAYTSEILRAQLAAIPTGDWAAARSLGLTRLQIVRLIIAPQVFIRAIPAYGNEFILLLKASSLLSTITVMELMGMTRQLVAQTYAPIEIFLAAGAIYLVLVQIATVLFGWIETRYGRWARPHA